MKKTIELKGVDIQSLLGPQDAHLSVLESHFQARIIFRGNEVFLDGDEQEVRQIQDILHEMLQTLSRKGSLTQKDVKHLVAMNQVENGRSHSQVSQVIHYGKKGAISPRTPGQQLYVEAVRANDIVFSVGPAGTGKTFIAVAFAVAALENHEVDRIILCRPAVEAGESLGFLPGDLKEKVDPYLAPLYDALGEMIPRERLKPLLEKRTIEVIPLAYMRGRTLNQAFLILDEAQNATSMQMKMFLTRLGVNSRAIITGDITQIDLPKSTTSGLVEVIDLLDHIDGIGFVRLSKEDVVRHELVRKIIHAYEQSRSEGDTSDRVVR
ncbi:MAG: PhoH family protein [Candidatus Neomarinimicrobiota bacterium]|nr:MAG: PhoH family protein [Candidatus Neomarinimicrobiota bacterium]